MAYHKKEICHKVSEKEFHQNQVSLINTHIMEIKNKSNSLCNDFISQYSDILLNKHPHFQKNHTIEVKTTYYYDQDWIRDTYGVRNPCDSYGIPYEYEGPDTLIYVICKKCIEENIVDVIKKPFYSKDLIDIHILGEKLLKEKILKNMKRELIKDYNLL